MIDTRPPEVETRSTVGHWEGDLIQGASKSGYLVTVVERRTRFTLVDRTMSKEAQEVTRTICRMFNTISDTSRLTLTLDNGKEFAWHERMATKTGMDIVFAHPYHSWERGTNENTNGLLRQYLPKGTPFTQLTNWQLACYIRQLNNRPRKCLNYRTPTEVFWKRTVALTM